MKHIYQFFTVIIISKLIMSVSNPGSLSADRARMFQDLIKKEYDLSDLEADYIARGKNSDNKLIQPENFQKRLKRIKESKKVDKEGGNKFVTIHRGNPDISVDNIIKDINDEGVIKNILECYGIDSTSNLTLVEAARGCALIGILAPTEEQIRATGFLFSAGLSRAHLNNFFINAYLANGEARAAALAMASRNAQYFNADYQAAWIAGVNANERLAIVKLATIEAYNADHIVDVLTNVPVEGHLRHNRLMREIKNPQKREIPNLIGSKPNPLVQKFKDYTSFQHFSEVYDEDAPSIPIPLNKSTSYRHLRAILKKWFDKDKSVKDNILESLLNTDYFSKYFNLKKLIPARSEYDRKRGRKEEVALTEKEKSFIASQLSKMIEMEAANPEKVAFYTSTSSSVAVFQDLYKKLNEIFSMKKLDGALRFNWKDFAAISDAKTFEEVIVKAQKQHKGFLDHADEFKKLGACGSLSPFQTEEAETAYYFWIRNADASENKLLTFLLETLGLDQSGDDALRAKISELTAMNLNAGGRMMQILINPEDLDKYSWLSKAYGENTGSVRINEEDDVEATKIPSKAIEFYRDAPSLFTQSHVENIKKAKISETDEMNLGSLQYRLLLHPELMLSDRVKIKTYSSLLMPMKQKNEYDKLIEKLAIELAQRWYKSKSGTSGVVASPFSKVLKLRAESVMHSIRK